MTGLVILLRNLQPPHNLLNIRLRGPDSRRRLLLERVQHIYDLFEPHRVYRPLSVAIEILDNFEHTGADSSPGLGGGMFSAELGQAHAFPISSLTSSGNVKKSRFEDPTQWSGFSPFDNTRMM
jgi:hypothetical protein